MTATLEVDGVELQLLPERAVWLPQLQALLVSDVHLGKSETFQRFGIPVSNQVNQDTLERLRRICDRNCPQHLWILGDLFHGRVGLVDEVIDSWLGFLNDTQVAAHLIVGNHDRPMVSTLEQLSLECHREAVDTEAGVLSHEPWPCSNRLNLCGHVHPCVRLRGDGDRLRLPCFFWEADQKRLTLPAFGEFTGGYDIVLRRGTVAFAIAPDAVVPFAAAPT